MLAATAHAAGPGGWPWFPWPATGAMHPGGWSNVIPASPKAGPVDGARVAVAESRFALEAAGQALRLDVQEASSEAEVGPMVAALARQGTRFILLDLPAPAVRLAARAVKPGEALLFNVSADDDELRGAGCAPHLLHTLPSRRMQADGVDAIPGAAQVAPRAVAERAVAGRRGAARRARARLPAASALPGRRSARSSCRTIRAERELGNLGLLTAGVDYDVVVVADADGEFARGVPYATQLPRLGGGRQRTDRPGLALGLGAQRGAAAEPAFHQGGRPSHDRIRLGRVGGCEGNRRKRARQPKDGFAGQAEALVSEAVVVDASRRRRCPSGAGDGQLRQPVLLAHPDGVVGVAPVEGVLHPKNNLDTLGADAADTACRPGK
ncbi:branched-chain amino acid ABC transporter substrate-binding protein [Cupriavidus basilensis]